MTCPDVNSPSFRLYGLPHTYARLLLAADAPLTYVSAQLGIRTRARRSSIARDGSVPIRGKRWVG